jgi:hypothetical protein
MLQGEKNRLDIMNTAGTMATEKLLKNFDTDGAPIKVGNQTFTSKGPQGKDYQTPYGTCRVDRHVYQSHSGGKTYCPLEADARIIITSTPKFAQMISSKYTQFGVRSVIADLTNNHGRTVQKKLAQDVSEAVGTIAIAKEENWKYELPEINEPMAGISIGLDGTCMLMKDEGWREAMTGTITFHDKFGERIHTTYVAAPPEYGKDEFLKKFELEIERVKGKYPHVYRLGLADGARSNWPFLNKHTDHQLIDFYHASEYLGAVGNATFSNYAEKEKWMEDRCHKLKHNMGAASRLISEFKEIKKELKSSEKEVVSKAISYFENNDKENRMQYYKFADSVLPIGSGATEAACKVIVKERMCKSGMRWKNEGAKIVLVTRCLHETDGRWDQFWNKVDQYGFNVAA